MSVKEGVMDMDMSVYDEDVNFCRRGGFVFGVSGVIIG